MTTIEWLVLGLLIACIVVSLLLSILVSKGATARKLILTVARKSWGWDGGDIPASFSTGLLTALLSVALGVWIYTHWVSSLQKGLVEEYVKRDVVSGLLAAEPGAYSNEPNADLLLRGQYLYNVLRRLGLLSREELRNGPAAMQNPPDPFEVKSGSPNLVIAYKTAQQSFDNRYHIGDSTLDLVIALSNPDKLPLADYELPATREVLAQILARIPENAAYDPALRDFPPHPRCVTNTEEPEGKCEKDAAEYVAGLKIPFASGLILHLPAELTPYQVVAKLGRMVNTSPPQPTADASGDQLASDEAVPRFQAALLDALRNHEGVRKQRMWLNAVVGWERLLILILALWFVSLSVVRAIQALPHEAHAIDIREKLAEMRQRWQDRFPPAEDRLSEARALLNTLSGQEAVKSRLITIPSTLLRAAVDEMTSRPRRAESTSGTAATASNPGAANPADTRAIETAAEGLRSRLNHSRVLFEALLPTFPAIGFIGTVTSLLLAMSKADQIVKATDSLARGSATAAVTDVLSLCFAATLMALVCLVVLAPLSLWQSAHEQHLVDNTAHLLQDVLKPEQA